MSQPDVWAPFGTAEASLDGIRQASGMSAEVAYWVGLLADEYAAHQEHNAVLRDYYEGHVTPSDYGVTAGIMNDQTCHWPSKAVDALADRIRLEGIVLPEGLGDAEREAAESALRRNRVVQSYNRHLAPKLIYGCMAAAVTRSASGDARVRYHSAETFTAIPSADGEDGVVAAGLVIARREHTPWSGRRMVPTVVNVHLPNNVVELRQVAASEWVASDGLTPEAEPSLYVFTHDGTGTLNPFGRTRITRFVRTLTDDAIRCMWHMQISGTYYSMPKLLMLNLASNQYDEVVDNKLKWQLDRVIATEMDELGEGATDVRQLSGNSPQPFVDELAALAKQFSGATGVPLNSLGIVQDNPSSAEAISAAREDICLIAQKDIDADGPVLSRVMRAALAVQLNTTVDRLGSGADGIFARFAEPMLTSKAGNADFVTKVASIRPGFGQTDYAARMVGIPDEELEGIKSDEAKAATDAAISTMFGGA